MADKKDYRVVMGERLRAFRESRSLTAYLVAQKGNIRIDQVRVVEEGEKNYTIDVFLGYIQGCDLYMFFGEKNRDPEDKLDTDDMLGSIKRNDPKL